MKRIHGALAALLLTATAAQPEAQDDGAADPEIIPVEHASLIIRTGRTTVYIDPVGDASGYSDYPGPDIILITHIHRDHMDPALIARISRKDTDILGPATVIEELGQGRAIECGTTQTVRRISIEAVPAYNTSRERLQFHPKSRKDNGYVITAGSKRIYISGDTEDIREMRELKNIDHAVICMNLPYTMTEEQAASAVLEMKPDKVTPYHYRGREGRSDLSRFRLLVEKGGKETEARLMDWYPRP